MNEDRRFGGVQGRALPGGPAGLSVLVAAILLISPLATASDSGYSLSYSRAAVGSTNANVDLTSLSTSPGAGATVSVTFQVSGSLVLDSASYFYWLFFGGGATSNATAYVYFANNETNGTYLSVAGGTYSYGPMYFTTGSGGSSLTFSINQSAVGPASSFSANAYAVQGSEESGTYSWIGTNYSGNGGTGTCTGNSCSSSSTGTSSSSSLSGAELLGLIGGSVVVIIVVALVAVLVVLPRRRSPPQSPPPIGAGAPPPTPPMAPPPPQ